jgi:DNA-binding response OmpR family regulator
MSPASMTRLLYAEADPDTREMIRLALQTAGFEVCCPSDLSEFLTVAKNERWDIFMLDTWMPEVDGFELSAKLREFDSRTPIVFYSGAALDRDKQRASECGAFAYFVKPLPIDDLIKGLHAAIASRVPAARTSTAT